MSLCNLFYLSPILTLQIARKVKKIEPKRIYVKKRNQKQKKRKIKSEKIVKKKSKKAVADSITVDNFV